MGPGKVFGELAILYNCTRTATIKALTGRRGTYVGRVGFVGRGTVRIFFTCICSNVVFFNP